MASTPSWAIDYFQINGSSDSVGESAIVLLVDKETSKKTPASPEGEIKKAVLVDGALSTFAVGNILATMTKIKADYSGPDNFKNGCLQFDAVVISHWDKVRFESGREIDPMLTSNLFTPGSLLVSAVHLITCLKNDRK